LDPAHAWAVGNETADELAKRAAKVDQPGTKDLLIPTALKMINNITPDDHTRPHYDIDSALPVTKA